MKHTATVALSALILLSGCASSQSQQKTAAYYADGARAAIVRNDVPSAVAAIDYALLQPSGGAEITRLFASHPKSRAYYRTYLAKQITAVSTPFQAASAFNKLSAVRSSGIFAANQDFLSETELPNLFALLDKVVTEGNVSGSISFDLSDGIETFPSLNSPPQQRLIVDRTIKALQREGTGSRPMRALIEYVKRIGAASPEAKRIESLLPTMNIRGTELDALADVFPAFAAARKQEIFARVFLEVKNADRLLADDLLQTLRGQIHGVDWRSSPGAGTTTLVIERIRQDEKTLPERTETISYATYQVNLAAAVLLMPRNASYLYDLVSGGAEIEYGYVVTAVTDGKKIHDEVIRGKVGGEYRRCQNTRIQNVFGGVSPASFVANGDMQQRCSGPSSASIDELRREVLSKVADGVLQVPPIKVANALNLSDIEKVTSAGHRPASQQEAKSFEEVCAGLKNTDPVVFKQMNCK